jgi:hypothetical protein
MRTGRFCILNFLLAPRAQIRQYSRMIETKYQPDMDLLLRSLGYAITEGDEATVASLIKSGVDVNAPRIPGDMYRNSPVIMLAAASGYPSICSLIIDAGADVNAKDGAGETALHYAAARGHLEACRLLIAAGANVDAVDTTGNTPMFSAIRHGEVGVFTLLVDSGASSNISNLLDVTPLHFAARYRRDEICRVLIARGADCRLPARAHSPHGSEGWYERSMGNLTPLHAAIDADRVDICRMLVGGGADGNYLPRNNVTRDYLTPLQMAVEMRRFAIVRYFLFECDLDWESTPVIFGGKTLMQVAGGSPKILEWLKAAKSERAVKRVLEEVGEESTVDVKPTSGRESLGLL